MAGRRDDGPVQQNPANPDWFKSIASPHRWAKKRKKF